MGTLVTVNLLELLLTVALVSPIIILMGKDSPATDIADMIQGLKQDGAIPAHVVQAQAAAAIWAVESQRAAYTTLVTQDCSGLSSDYRDVVGDLSSEYTLRAARFYDNSNFIRECIRYLER